MPIEDSYEELDDDPDIAFTQLVAQFDAQLASEVNRLDDSADSRRYLINHMNKILAAASALSIDAFNSWRLPSYEEAYGVHSDFELAVQSYVMQVRIRRSRTGKVYSVSLDTATKGRIRNLTKRIREVLDAADLDERKRNSLFQKLQAFEADVDRARTRFDNAMLAMIDVAAVVRENVEALNPLTELVTQINQLLGWAKAKEPDQQQLPPPLEQKRIEPPRKQIEDKRSRDADDDIPF